MLVGVAYTTDEILFPLVTHFHFGERARKPRARKSHARERGQDRAAAGQGAGWLAGWLTDCVRSVPALTSVLSVSLQTTDFDKDERYMATSDLCVELNKDVELGAYLEQVRPL